MARARLKDDDLFFRRGDRAGPRRPVRPIMLFLIVISLALMILSRLHHSALTDMRWHVASSLALVLQAATFPAEPFREIGHAISSQLDLTAELQRLRGENQKLSGWEWRAKQLEARLADLERLAKVVPEQNLEFVTSRVIADSSGAFARSVMINSGSQQNVKAGYPVINADGLVGRVVDVGPNSSRVLLSTDADSRVPVRIGTDLVRGILAGDNGTNPRLLYLPDGAKISPGDEVSTSGTGGLFPPGLRIGTVIDGASAPRVGLRANLDRLEYVSVIFFDDPSRAIAEDLSAARANNPVRSEQSPRSEPAGGTKP
jgi:rod shape-determining protein MreC